MKSYISCNETFQVLEGYIFGNKIDFCLICIMEVEYKKRLKKHTKIAVLKSLELLLRGFDNYLVLRTWKS